MNFHYIVWHTAAHGRDGKDYDTSAAEIDSWHKVRGWQGIGYHFVVRKDGRIETGRSTANRGAHVAGLNSKALGICLSGHGDITPLTDAQMQAGLGLTARLMEDHDIAPRNVIGHREVNALIPSVLSEQYRTDKSCPGRLVSMDAVRFALNNGAVPTDAPEPRRRPRIYFAASAPSAALQRHTHPLQTALAQMHLYHGKIDGWPGRMTSDAVREAIGVYLDGDPKL